MARKRAQTSANPNLQESKDDGNTQKGSSGYEQFREERIKENLERMQKLGILDLSLQFKSVKPSVKSTPFTRKTPLRFSPLPASGPTRRSSRLQNATPVSYSEVNLAKKDKSLEVEDDLLNEEGSKPEIYTEEHEKLLGSTEQTWTLFVDGCGKDGKRIYDPVNGKTCHQCRQKTLGHRTHCSKCNMVQGQFCGDCLYMRYGEHVLEAKQNPNWLCPVCRGICNCSLCRQAKGWPATGALYRKISSLGYKSVAHYLIQTRHAKTETEIDLSTNVPLSAKRSLPFVEMETTSSEKESSESNNPGGLGNPNFEGAISEKNLNGEVGQETHCSVKEQDNCKLEISEKNLNGEVGQETHCSVKEQDNCKLASEITAELMQKPEVIFDSVDDLQGLLKPETESNGTKDVLHNEKGKGIQLLVHNEDSYSDTMKKSEEPLMEPVLRESSDDPTGPTPVLEEHKTNKEFKDDRDENICLLDKRQYGKTSAPEKTPGSKKKRVRTTDLVADSIAGRLRQRRIKNNEHEDSSQVEVNGGTVDISHDLII